MAAGGDVIAYREAVAAIYARYLPDAPHAPDDSLFDLGADSLMIVNLVLDLERGFGLEIPFETLADVQSIGQMAAWLAAQGASLPTRRAPGATDPA